MLQWTVWRKHWKFTREECKVLQLLKRIFCPYLYSMLSIYKKWLFDYKLLHVFLWGCVGLFLFISDYDNDYNISLYIGQSVFVPLASCIPFYTSAYYFVPKYLYTHKYVQLIILLIVFVAVTAVLQVIIIRFILHYADNRLSVIPDADNIVSVFYMAIWNNTLCVFIAGGLKVISDRSKMEKKLLQTEKEKISTELDFLRSQINPHFLFNMMNTVYFQIDKSNVTARESMEKLSEMLRYQLYECSTDRIEIFKEMEYIKSYVAMQTLRLEKGSDIQLHAETGAENFTIAPLLILPIVENAFKHISHYKDTAQNKIHIHLTRQSGQFIINVSNTYNRQSNTTQLINSGGLGVQNVKRRLELLYPGKYELNIVENGHYFHTALKIDIQS